MAVSYIDWNSMQYGLTLENMNAIDQKAKDKADGIFRFRGIVYRVRDKRVTHVAHGGWVLERFGHFNVRVGSYESGIGGETRATALLRTLG